VHAASLVFPRCPVLANEAPGPSESEQRRTSGTRVRGESSRIEEIVVTGRRREEMLQKTPLSIAAFDANTSRRAG
jgi:hypothetical protein